MEILIGLQGLEEEIGKLAPDAQVLERDLRGRNPDDGMTAVPYEKGAAFLHRLQQVFGRAKFDAFLHGYFNAHAFQSIATADFLRYLDANLLRHDPAKAAQVDVQQWIHAPGLPPDVVRPANAAFHELDDRRARWLAGSVTTTELRASDWITQLWLRFLNGLPAQVHGSKLAELDATYGLTRSKNSEVFVAWAAVAMRNGMPAIDAPVEQFLLTVGRRKYLKPLYEALAATPSGKQRAQSIYHRSRPRYHAVATRTLDEILR
jgi:hypothetical protein